MPVSAPSPSRPAVLGFAARYPWVLATLVVVALTLGPVSYTHLTLPTICSV